MTMSADPYRGGSEHSSDPLSGEGPSPSGMDDPPPYESVVMGTASVSTVCAGMSVHGPS